MAKYNCIVCNKEFEARPCKKRKFCSRQCAGIFKKGKNHPNFKEKIVKNCENCGKEFEVHECRKDARFCSVKCANEIIGKENRKRVTLICKNCNKEYEIIESQAERGSNFCCKQCQIEFNKQEVVELTCKICGIKYERPTRLAGNSKYCSKKCMYSDTNEVKIICGNCGKEFYINPYAAEKRRFCSRKCKNKFSEITLKCECCGKEFKSYKSSNRKYCSHKCSVEVISKERKERFTLKCIICNKEYEIIKSKLEKSNYCSMKCKNVHYGLTHRGENNPQFNRIKLICEICGKEYEVNGYKKDKSKFCSMECFNLYKKISNAGKGNPNYGNYKYTKEEYEKWIDYRNAVRSRSYITFREFYEDINPLNLEIGRNLNHLDHIYSVHDGFHNNVPVSIMSSKENLRVISAEENLKKNAKSDIELNELITLYENEN